METSTLRWILIVVGVLIVASIFLFGNPEKKRKPKASRKVRKDSTQRLEPTLDGSAAEDAARELELEGQAADDGLLGQGELDIGGEPAPARPEPPPGKPAGPPPDKIVSLFLLATDNRVITGEDIHLGFALLVIPYIGTVITLPIWYTFRAFSLEFLAQFGLDYDLFPPATAPPDVIPA